MPVPPATAFGVPHRALRDLQAWIYPRDALGVATRLLRGGTVFVPWPPSDHARGHRIPITLGIDGTAAPRPDELLEVVFLRHEDFMRCCQRADQPPPARVAAPVEAGPLPGPFDELPAIAARLRAARGDDIAADLGRLAALAAEHADAAAFELAAAGFDNTEGMRIGADRQARALAAARALLQQLWRG